MCSICFDDDQLYVAYLNGLYRFTFHKKSNNNAEREDELHSANHQTGIDRAGRMFVVITL